jgi:hypothetical protein
MHLGAVTDILERDLPHPKEAKQLYQLTPECRTCYETFRKCSGLATHLQQKPWHQRRFCRKKYNVLQPGVKHGWEPRRCPTCARSYVSEKYLHKLMKKAGMRGMVLYRSGRRIMTDGIGGRRKVRRGITEPGGVRDLVHQGRMRVGEKWCLVFASLHSADVAKEGLFVELLVNINCPSPRGRCCALAWKILTFCSDSRSRTSLSAYLIQNVVL